MRKIFVVIMACTMLFALGACGNAANGSEEYPVSETNAGETPAVEEETSAEESASEETTEVISESETENTEAVAAEIQNQTGADSFRIVPVEPYTDDYDSLLDIAQEEQRNDARPEISGSIENFDSYEVIYLGYPNWWGDMPMILYSFLDDYDLSGKTIVPFVTSGGSGFSNTISTIETMEPDANVLEGLSVGSSQAANPGSAVTDWLNKIGLAE